MAKCKKIRRKQGTLKLFTGNLKIDKFIKNLLQSLNRYEVRLYISVTNYVEFHSDKSNGFFNDKPKEFAVSFGRPTTQWLCTLIHESCHFDQWRTNSKIWTTYRNAPNIFTGIQPHSKWSKKKLLKAMLASRNLEWDCELRTMEKIRKYKLPISLTAYKKQAASYVLFYEYMMIKKKWYKIGCEPYNIPEVYNYAVKLFKDLNKEFHLDKKMIQLYDKYCI